MGSKGAGSREHGAKRPGSKGKYFREQKILGLVSNNLTRFLTYHCYSAICFPIALDTKITIAPSVDKG